MIPGYILNFFTSLVKGCMYLFSSWSYMPSCSFSVVFFSSRIRTPLNLGHVVLVVHVVARAVQIGMLAVVGQSHYMANLPMHTRRMGILTPNQQELQGVLQIGGCLPSVMLLALKTRSSLMVCQQPHSILLDTNLLGEVFQVKCQWLILLRWVSRMVKHQMVQVNHGKMSMPVTTMPRDLLVH
nr:hypothetical protein Iba_chr06bCG5570 [Ipomoea batatas]